MSRPRSSAENLVENMLEEWKRGMLTFWVLGLLLQRPMYGLEIKNEIQTSTQGKLKVGGSTIYQMLRRLESRGIVSSLWEKTEAGPPRAYYELTRVGREVVFRYADEVFSPASPISAALSEVTSKIFLK